MGRTLIVVDMQNDFVYGPLGTPEARAIVPNVQKKIEEYRGRCDDIIFTRDCHDNDYLCTHEGKYLPVVHCLEHDISGSALVVPMEWGETVLEKRAFGYLSWNYFAYVSHSSYIELIGVCTDICVVSNALILRSMFPEMDITVDASCCAGTTPEKHKAALEVMKSCHIDILND